MERLELNGENLTVDRVYSFVRDEQSRAVVADGALVEIERSRSFVEESLGANVVYGVNTGFGPMASHIIHSTQLEQLQVNLIRSHAVGLGKPLNQRFVLSAMLVRLNTFLKGYAGVSRELIERYCSFINQRIVPVVPEHGAVGTSGDLVELAHIALALIGEGEVWYHNIRMRAAEVLKMLNIQPYILKPKEGLSLINGTAMMTGISALLCAETKRLIDLVLRAGALSLELVDAYSDSFSEKLNFVRPHVGQGEVARKMRELLQGSKLIRDRELLHVHVNDSEADVKPILESVQEVYSLRCTPQILGPIVDTLNHTRGVVDVEMNSATDNPIVDTESKKFLHGGNFHGDYVSLAIDHLKIALVKLTMFSERRINYFLHHDINKRFPPFMNLKTPGLTLGLQGLQFVATSTAAKSQTLAFPQYVHSIPTNADNQDVVSMGTNSALIAARVLENAYVVLAIELLTLAQGVDFLNIREKLSSSSKELFDFVRHHVPKIVEDRDTTGELNSFVDSLKQS